MVATINGNITDATLKNKKKKKTAAGSVAGSLPPFKMQTLSLTLSVQR